MIRSNIDSPKSEDRETSQSGSLKLETNRLTQSIGWRSVFSMSQQKQVNTSSRFGALTNYSGAQPRPPVAVAKKSTLRLAIFFSPSGTPLIERDKGRTDTACLMGAHCPCLPFKAYISPLLDARRRLEGLSGGTKGNSVKNAGLSRVDLLLNFLVNLSQQVLG